MSLAANAASRKRFSRDAPMPRRSILPVVMWERVTSYKAVLAGDGESFGVFIKYGSGDATLDITDAALFGAWAAMLATGKAEFDPKAQQLRVTG